MCRLALGFVAQIYSKTCVKWPLSKRPKLVFRTIDEFRSKALQNAPKGAFCDTFDLHCLPFVIKIFVLSIFEWPFYTGFTVSTKVLYMDMV